ncbi:hypothetical protein GCM10022213_22260 [Parerythrobacter jejuensis]
MIKNLKTKAATAVALGTLAMAAPANATIFEYDMTNGDLLTIDTDKSTATWKGKNIDTVMTSPDFAKFTGGANPRFTAVLTSLDGTRTIRGKTYTDNPKNINTTHPQKLIGQGSRFNLWAWWGDPIKGGDYIKHIGGYTATEVPAPGMLGLFGLALAALGFRRRRSRMATAKLAAA